jgi:hypothetical protein
METLDQKIKELETKYKEQLKAEKAKLMAKYRAKQKQEKQAQEKELLAKISKYRKLINHDDVFLGGILRTLEVVNSKDTTKINQLIELTKTLNV